MNGRKAFKVGVHIGEASVGLECTGGVALLKGLFRMIRLALQGTGKAMKAVGTQLDK